MTTFADLGMPFPLFAAPTGEATEYVGLAACVLCGRPGRHCFALRIGCAILLPCPDCATLNGLDLPAGRQGGHHQGHRDRHIFRCTACGMFRANWELD